MKSSNIRLIVGLGNPGAEYAQTRHNAGQDLVELLAHSHNCSLTPNGKHFGYTGRCQIAGEDRRLLVPTTFMNRSGQAIASLAQFFKISAAEILVVHDELDLAPGTVRLKSGGGHGGHNGLRDTIRALGNDNGFARLRIGIGHPGAASLVASYVLKRAPSAEQSNIHQAIVAAIAQMPNILNGDLQAAMRELHSKK
ncbi:MAG: aminoacyl-tRNA hydrolase [Cellvibrionaceae bacterium]|nr:aminoacyl-tRNA hydrolase [Cellvibrionaceae bacterium]